MFILPDKRITEALNKTLQEQKPVLLEIEYKSFTADKTTPVKIIFAPLTDEKTDNLSGGIGIVEDISERIKRDKELEESNERLQLAMDAADHGFWDWDLITGSTYFSPKYYTMLGYEPGELPMNRGTWEKLIHPEDYKFIFKKIKEAVEGCRPFEERFRMKCKDGSWKWISGKGKSFYKDESGKPYRAAGIHEDITFRIETEEALRKSETRYRELVDLAVDGIITGSKDGLITSANRRASEITGFDEKTIIGMHISKLFTGDELQKNPLRFDLLNQGLTVVNNRKMIRPDGSEVIIEMHSKKMPDATYQSILRDITEKQKLIESSQKSQKLESLGILAGGIAHDFNNLLGGILSNIDLARIKNCDPNLSAYLEKAIGTIDRARGLTRQLLTFASGGDPVKRITPLSPLIADTVNFALSGSKVSAHFTISADLHQCMIDKAQIEQVIENIVINAIQAMPMGGILEVSAENISGSGIPGLPADSEYIKVSITDQGVGIPEDIIKHIFDPFFTTKSKGHGLGLATSYSIINRHDGSIEVESKPGAGSTFKIYLPAAYEKETPLYRETNITHKGEGSILIMDDEEAIRDILSAMLKHLGYTAICARDGEEALEILTRKNNKGLDLAAIILDLTVPGGMGGEKTVKEIRKFNRTIPIFVSSGYSEDPAISRPEDFGFTDSISKPFQVQELAEMLRRNNL